MSKEHRVLTGITTTGVPHLGNLVGAVLPAIKASETKDTTSFLFLCVGIVAGWTAKDFVHDYLWSRDEAQYYHPEMYDDNGFPLNEELLSVKFINEEDEDETLDA